MENLHQQLEQSRAENIQNLTKLEELTDFVENASIPLHWVDANGIITWANQAELDALGYSKADYIGKPIALFHADPPVIADILNKLSANQTLRNYPARLLASDGSIRHVLISSNVLQKDGKFIRTRCFTKDITEIVLKEQAQAELHEALAKSESHLRMAVELTGLGTWELNTENETFTCSQQCLEAFGVSSQASISWEILTNGASHADKQVLQQQLKNLRKNHESFQLIYCLHRPDATGLTWIKLKAKPLIGEDHRVQKILGTVLDISSEKISEEKTAKLVAIIQSTDDAIVSKTVEGIITSWNPSAERIFGYTEQQMIGRSVTTLIPDDRQQEEPEILNQLRQGKRVEHFETKRLRKDNSLVDVSLTISPIKDPTGQIIGLSKIARDITQKKLEEQRKNDFVAMVSHELKTPLTSISAYLQLLLDRAKAQADQFNLNALTKVSTQTQRMIAMIKDFLTLARMEDGKIWINKQPFPLHPLIEEVREDAQFLTKKHTIEVVNCQHINLLADRDKLSQVISNLISNAIKYSPHGGKIIIGCQTEQNQVMIFVSDQGIGIERHNQKKLFDRFYRVSNDSTKTASGFGIGLYLCSEILRLHGSSLQVESEPGIGSNFFFYLENHYQTPKV